MHVKESKVTEVPVTSVSNLQTDWYSETTLDGTITTNVSQNVNMDKDMIIGKIYVSQGDDVKKGDNLISFDMTLVEMELNIAKLKQQKQEQDVISPSFPVSPPVRFRSVSSVLSVLSSMGPPF